MGNNLKLYVKYDLGAMCKKILTEQLSKLEIVYTLPAFGEVEIKEPISNEKLKQLNTGLKEYGIEIVESHKSILVQKIKDAVIEMIYLDEKLPNSKISAYLANKLNHSYSFIYNIFSEVTLTSIEKFIILQKIERAKEMLVANELTCTEIAWKLNYSSVAHFSAQFKNAIGITPSAFQRIIDKRRSEAKQQVDE